MAVNKTTIKLSEFSSMSQSERKERVDALFQAATNPTPEQRQAWVKQVGDEIQEYESRYKMSSDEMLQALESGQALKIPEICTWLTLLKTRGQIEQKYGGSRSK
jgi:nucleoid DNA-binding protein